MRKGLGFQRSPFGRRYSARFARLDRPFAWFADAVLGSGFARTIGLLAGLAGFAVLMLTAWQISEDYSDRKAERIERAWSNLLRPVGGATGKEASLNYLWQQGADLTGLDISCLRIGTWNANASQCERRPFLGSISLARRTGGDLGSEFGEANRLFGLRAQGVQIKQLRMDGVFLHDADFADSTISFFHAVRSKFVNIRFPSEHPYTCRIVDSEFDTEIVDFISGCEISGSVFTSTDVSNLAALMAAPKQEYSYPIPGFFAVASNPPLVETFDYTPSADFPSGVHSVLPWSVEIMQRVTLCAKVVPNFSACEEISYEEAKKRYPNAYQGRKMHLDLSAGP